GPPGVPTRQGQWGEPDTTGVPLPLLRVSEGAYRVPPAAWGLLPVQSDPTKDPVPGVPVKFAPAATNDDVRAGYGFKTESAKNPEQNQYFFHPDHLGSSNYITDREGRVRQHIEYLPFGETLGEESHNNDPAQPYRFTGKEQDPETGLYYFGARYYDGFASLWLSVDPLTEKYPGWSGYNYVMWNPVAFVDPDGRFSIPNHIDITDQAAANAKISTLSRFTLSVGASTMPDIFMFFLPSVHFDNVQGLEAVQSKMNDLTTTINNRMGKIGSVNKRFGGWDMLILGKNFHTLEDFYAHSNYVQLYAEYYAGENNGSFPSTVPLFEDGIKIDKFREMLSNTGKDSNGRFLGLQTGKFNLLDNEFWDLLPGDWSGCPNCHEQIAHDKPDSRIGQLKKQTAERAVMEHMKKLE
ncbi:MAG: RHS repeat-associated core domain-containing protein, partial [Saprospiraceae bacterium]